MNVLKIISIRKSASNFWTGRGSTTKRLQVQYSGRLPYENGKRYSLCFVEIQRKNYSWFKIILIKYIDIPNNMCYNILLKGG